MVGMKILLFLFLLTQCFQIEGFQIEDGYYYHNRIQCVKCPRGHKISNHCSKEFDHSECKPCEEGTFAVRLSSSEQCGKCTDCSPLGLIIKNNCTAIRDTECQCPDKKYFDAGICKTCEAPKVKRVKNEKETCEECENGYYYDSTQEDCVKCDICTKDQVILQVCNATHNSLCKQTPTTSPLTTHVSSTNPVSSAEKNEDGLSGGEIAAIVISLIIIVGLLIIIILKKKKKYCFKEEANRETDEEVGKPLTGSNTGEVHSSQPSQSKLNDSGAGTHLIENGVSDKPSSISSHREYSETQNNSPQAEAHEVSSKPEWLNRIRRILINNLDVIGVFASHLGTDEFNASAKWKQLDGKDFEPRFYEFMDIWYEKTIDPSLEKIVSVLRVMNKNDIIDIVVNDGDLQKQLNKRNISNDDHTVQSDNQPKHPIQASDDDHVDYRNAYRNSNPTESLDNQQISFGLARNIAMSSVTDPQDGQSEEMNGEQLAYLKKPSMEDKKRKVIPEQNIPLTKFNGAEQTRPKEIDGFDLDEEQTNPKQLAV